MSVRLLDGDCRTVLPTLPDASVQCVVTSPPYWGLRDYGHAEQIGLEPTPGAYVAALVGVFREVRRVLRDDGTLWLNLGDSYCGARGGEQGAGGQMADRTVAAARCRVRNVDRLVGGLKPKDLVGIPWRVAFALQADGWWLRSDIIWAKPNPMPESVTDRPTKAHEYLFLLAKSERYYYDADAIAEPATHAGKQVRTNGNAGMDDGYDGHRTRDGFRRGIVVGESRNRRSVWTVATEPTPDAHFATMPTKLVAPCILAGSRVGDTVLDPFGGTATTARVAEGLGRHSICIELNPDYLRIAERKTAQRGLFAQEISA